MSVDFYGNLKAHKLTTTNVLQEQYFTNVPADWHVVIADIKNSTKAVNIGRHNDVNLIAAGSLIAGLNVAKEHNIEIPFFFGGDGGTMLVPGEILSKVLEQLHVHNLNSIKNFDLELHTGSISLLEIMNAGCFIKLAKLKQGKGFNKAIIIGDGLKYAENEIKKNNKTGIRPEEEEINLNGLECRWDKIKPPIDANEVVCYIIEAVHAKDQIRIYREVLTKIDEIYGNIEKRNPLSMERLKLLISFKKMKKEMLAKYGRFKADYFTTSYLKTFIGKLYFKFNLKVANLRGKQYLNQVIEMADTLIIDGRINTIITGTKDKRNKLVEYLAQKEKDSELIFGHHLSGESIMTCYIENRDQKHIHFVDGSDGGYTEAAKELKEKFKA